ncbi:hypothetical protein HMPREF3190_01269 [Umbribacter vaginalis]|nr:hypothetical protein HMPREF3190_01269 [Coriobacteriales bacterium DNF00809]
MRYTNRHTSPHDARLISLDATYEKGTRRNGAHISISCTMAERGSGLPS